MEADVGHALIAEQIIAFAGMSHKVPREMWSIKSKIGTKRHFGCKKHVVQMTWKLRWSSKIDKETGLLTVFQSFLKSPNILQWKT